VHGTYKYCVPKIIAIDIVIWLQHTRNPTAPTPILAILRHISQDVRALFLWMYVVGWLVEVGHARYCGQMAEVTTDELTIVLKFGLDRPYNGAEP